MAPIRAHDRLRTDPFALIPPPITWFQVSRNAACGWRTKARHREHEGVLSDHFLDYACSGLLWIFTRTSPAPPCAQVARLRKQVQTLFELLAAQKASTDKAVAKVVEK